MTCENCQKVLRYYDDFWTLSKQDRNLPRVSSWRRVQSGIPVNSLISENQWVRFLSSDPEFRRCFRSFSNIFWARWSKMYAMHRRCRRCPKLSENLLSTRNFKDCFWHCFRAYSEMFGIRCTDVTEDVASGLGLEDSIIHKIVCFFVQN